jgi:hypothetical protein
MRERSGQGQPCRPADPPLRRRWRHAGGPEKWVVACICGTAGDDGERMVACDHCGIWQHLRCNNIPEEVEEALEAGFICGQCAKEHPELL